MQDGEGVGRQDACRDQAPDVVETPVAARFALDQGEEADDLAGVDAGDGGGREGTGFGFGGAHEGGLQFEGVFGRRFFVGAGSGGGGGWSAAMVGVGVGVGRGGGLEAGGADVLARDVADGGFLPLAAGVVQVDAAGEFELVAPVGRAEDVDDLALPRSADFGDEDGPVAEGAVEGGARGFGGEGEELESAEGGMWGDGCGG